MDAFSSDARRFSAESLERLQQHSLFRFQIQDAQVRAHVDELREMLVGAKDEPDHFDIVTELVHVIEDEIQDSDSRELYLLASLQHFTHEMEMLLEMDTETELNPDDMPSFASIFARESNKQMNKTSKSSSGSSKAQHAVTPRNALPKSSNSSVSSPPVAAKCDKNDTPTGKSVKPLQAKPIAVAKQQERAVESVRPIVTAAATAVSIAPIAQVPPQQIQNPAQPIAATSPYWPQKPAQQSLSVQRIQQQLASDTGAAANAPEVEDDLPCSVCFEGDSLEGDPIVICELCSVAVHQTCYRVAFLPEGDWYCHPCSRYLKEQDVEKNVTPTRELQCVACLTKGGAMVPTFEGEWMHMYCSMYLPELYVQRKGDLGEVICGVVRRRLCSLWFVTAVHMGNADDVVVYRFDKAACAQCAYGKCTVSYHVECALKNKIRFAFIEAQRQFGSGCLMHQSKFLSMDGLNVDDDTEVETTAAPAPAQSPREQQRQTPSSKQEKAKQAKLDKKTPKERKKARSNSWEDGGGNEKDEHVLIGSDSEDDEALHPSAQNDGAADAVQFVKVQKPSSGRKRQLKLESGARLDDQSARNLKKSRQSTLSFGFAKPSIVTTNTAAPPSTPATAADTPSAGTLSVVSSYSANLTSRLVLQTRVFVPAYYPPGLQNGDGDKDYEYLMILIQSQPLGMVIVSNPTPYGTGVFLNGVKTMNAIVREALKKGVIRDGDELFAVNQSVLRNVNLEDVHEIILKTKTPIQCWFRTKRRSPPVVAPPTPAVTSSRQQSELKRDAQIESKKQDTIVELVKDLPGAAALSSPVKESTTAVALSGKSKQSRDEDGLSVDWPWFFLRSDGKIAMNLFWRSLDGAFFISKINQRVLLNLQNTIETMVGVRFSRDHAAYDQVQDLLVMPKREYVPQYIIDFRKSRKQKKKFLSSDIFMGVSAETLKDEDEVDEQTSIAVGTVVTVAKRTWAGINKLGGAGRVRKVHEETLEEGKKRFKYDISYVLGGGEKKVERKYISVVDLNNETDNTPKEEGTSEASQKSNSDAKEDDFSTIKMRLSVQVDRSNDETLLTALTALAVSQPQPVPTRRTFEFQISTENGNVFLQPKASTEQTEPGPKDLLLHKHFEVKLNDEDAIVKASFQSTLLLAEERSSEDLDDLGDEDESDNDEEDEIKSQLESLQQEFAAALTRSQETFMSIKTKMEQEYATKAYRKRILEEIQWKHQEQMYRDIVAAKEQFEDSDEEDESDTDVPGQQRAAKRTKTKEPVSSDDEDEENEDDTFGGLFVNKIKQEGDEVCVLCELSGGDFAATSCGHVVHPQCAMYTPETFFKDGVCHGIDQIPAQRRSLPCAICHTRKGLSKIQCSNKRCVVAYHISCAFINGLLIRDPHYLACCPKHMKSSGLAHEVDLPKHLQKASEQGGVGEEEGNGGSVKKQKKRATHGKKGRRETPRAEKSEHPGAISSSKTNKKRKRKSSVRTDAVEADDDDKLDENGRSCVRRLDINEDSEGEVGGAGVKSEPVTSQEEVTSFVPTQVFTENDVVMVLAREWIGSNKPGGVARVKAVHKVLSESSGTEELFYDVAYVLTSKKEKRVEAEYVRAYESSEQESPAGPSVGNRKKSRVQ